MTTEEIKSWMEQEQVKQQNKYITLLSDIHQQNWSPDQSYPMGHCPIRYVSTAKMKRTFTLKNLIKIEEVADKDNNAERDSTLSKDAHATVPDTPTEQIGTQLIATPKSEVSGVWRKASENAYRTIISTHNLPQEVRGKMTSLYNVISNNADAKAFIGYKQGLGL